MSIPRFRAHHIVTGKDVNLVLDYLQSGLGDAFASELPSLSGGAVGGGGGGTAGLVNSVRGSTGLIVNPVSGDVVVSTSAAPVIPASNLGRAYKGNPQAITTQTTIIFETVSASSNGQMGANGVFTAAVKGIYLVNAQAEFATTGYVTLGILVNGLVWEILDTDLGYASTIYHPSATVFPLWDSLMITDNTPESVVQPAGIPNQQNNPFTCYGTRTVSLAAGDVVTIYASATLATTCNNGADLTFFEVAYILPT